MNRLSDRKSGMAGARPSATGSRASTEPSSTVSALAGFDPARGAENLLPRLTPAQAAFIMRMEPSVLDQEISQFDWDNIDPKVDNPNADGWPYWHWFGGMRLHWPAGRATDDPEITFRFNNDGLAARERLCATRQGDAQSEDPQ